MRVYCLVLICLSLSLAVVSCGIREYPHEREPEPSSHVALPALVDAAVTRLDAAAMQDEASAMDADAYAQDAAGGASKLVLNGVPCR